MLFHSLAFAVFLPTVLTLYWLLRETKHQNALLLATSLFFYGWWDARFLVPLSFSILVDWLVALRIGAARERGERGKPWIVLSLVTQLGMLGVFKYYDFFIESAIPIWNALGWRPDLLHAVLPVGISFYTFQTLSYTIDVTGAEMARRRCRSAMSSAASPQVRSRASPPCRRSRRGALRRRRARVSRRSRWVLQRAATGSRRSSTSCSAARRRPARSAPSTP